MSEPKKVLLVTNSATDAEITEIKRAVLQAEQSGMMIKLSLVHVIPTLPTCYFNIPSMVLLAERYYEEAKQSLTYVGDLLNINRKDQWLITGRIRTEVLRLANKLNSHFILASSSTLQDLHKTFLFNREQSNTPIKSINHLSIALK
jgi:hypothetical protein